MLRNESELMGSSKTLIFLISIILVGFFLRIHYLHNDIPLVLDGLRYFFLGMDISILGNLPIGYDKTNIGWPLFLSIIFQNVRFENYLDYMALQKICSVIFSTLTVIPMYFFIRKFLKDYLAVIGASFFIFSPYIIENSLLGITDAFFIFLIVSFFALFFSRGKNSVIFSFFILGLSSIIRYESLLLIIPATIIFLNRFKNENNFKKFYFCGLVLFFVTIIPIAIWKMQMGIPDGVISHLWGGAYVVVNENSFNSFTSDRFDVIRGLISIPKFISFSLLPFCFIFVPYTIITLLKKESYNFKYLFLMGIISLIPTLYAYGRGFEEIRYVFVVFPIFILLGLYFIEKIILKTGKKDFLTILFVLLIILSSVIFLDFRQTDYEREKEVLEIAEFVSKLDGKSNDYGRESYYVEVMDLNKEKFPILSNEINFKSKIVLLQGQTIIEKMNDAKDKGISYLIVTSDNLDRTFLEVYDNEEKYDYLEKIFDSEEDNFKFKVKIFKINFAKFDS